MTRALRTWLSGPLLALLAAPASPAPLLPLPQGVAAPAPGPAVLVRLESLELTPDDEVVHRWYRLLRAGPDGVLVGLPQLVHPGDGSSLRVLRARRLGPGAGDLAWRREPLEPGSMARRLVFPAEGYRPDEQVEVLLERRVRSELAGLDLSAQHGFGLDVPVALDILEVRAPPGRSLRYLARGLGGRAAPEVADEAGARVLRWRVPAPPPGVEAPARPYVRVTGLESWDQAAAWYRPRWRARLAPGPRVRAALAGAPPTEWRARVAAEVAAVTAMPYRHRLEGSLADWMGRPAEEVQRRGEGNCADKANLLVARLALRGIEAEPVVVAGDPARPLDPEVPTFQPGDHVLVRVHAGAGALWVDPTEAGYTLGELPPPRREQLAWAPLAGELLRSPPGQDGVHRRLDATLEASGALRGRYRVSLEGRAAARLRRAWARGYRDLARWLPPRAEGPGALEPLGLDMTRPLELVADLRMNVPLLPGVGLLLRPPLPPPRPDEAGPRGELREDVRVALAEGLQVAALPPPQGGPARAFQAGWSAEPGGLRYRAAWSGGEGSDAELAAARSHASRATVRILPRSPASP